jgi:hypothetical protein
MRTVETILTSPGASISTSRLTVAPVLRLINNRLHVGTPSEAPAAAAEVWYLEACGLAAILTVNGELFLVSEADMAEQL